MTLFENVTGQKFRESVNGGRVGGRLELHRKLMGNENAFEALTKEFTPFKVSSVVVARSRRGEKSANHAKEKTIDLFL